MPLTINKTLVNNLSGPVSMYILEPNDSYLERFPYAPILILFGDVHNSDTDYCNPIGKKIYDKEFLQLINEAVGAKKEEKDVGIEDGKVDFYIEGGEIHQMLDEEKDKDEFPMKQLWNLFKNCYTNSRMKGREEYNPTCTPIKNIRWQSGDIRFFKKEAKKFDPSRFLKDIYKEFQERVAENKKEDPDYTLRLSLITKRILYKQFNNISVDAGYIFPIKTFDVNTEYITNSLIGKQLNKINSMGNDVYTSELLAKFKKYIVIIMKQSMERFSLISGGIESIEIFGKLTLITNNLINIFNCEPFSTEENAELEIMKTYIDKDLRPAYYSYFLDMKTVMLDLYTLARIYKTMIKHPSNTDAVQPLIAMCYFGDFHIRNMKTYLLEDSYTCKFSIDQKTPTSRCLDFKDDYNLDSIIDKLKTIRKVYEQKIKI